VRKALYLVVAVLFVTIAGCIQKSDNTITIDLEKGFQEAKNLTETAKSVVANQSKKIPSNVTIKIPDLRRGKE